MITGSNLSRVRVGKAQTPSDLYRNAPLENVSCAAFQDPSVFVAGAAFAPVGSADETGFYYDLTMNSVQRNKAAVRAPGTASEEGTWDLAKTTFLCEQYAYKEKLPEELVQSGAMFDEEEAVAASVAEVLLISREIRWASAYFKTGVWAKDMIGQAAADATHYIFWSSATGVPINDIEAEKNRQQLNGRRTGNTLVCGADVIVALLNNPQIAGKVTGGATPDKIGIVQLQQLAVILGLDRVLVGRGVYNTANEGATAVPSFILGAKSAWLGYVPPKPARRTPAAGYRFVWEGLAGNLEGVRTFRWWDQNTHSWYVESIENDVFKVVNANLGTFFSLIVQ